MGNLLEQLHDLHRGLRVQRAGRLVGQQDLRVVHQRPRDGHALHLAAGHLIRLLAQLVAQSDALQRAPGAGAAFAAGDARERQRQLHVLQDRLMRDQVIALEHEADGVVAVGIPVPVAELARGAALDQQVSGCILIQPADDVQERRLAAARRPEHRDKFLFPEIQCDPAQRVDRGISGGVVLYDLLQPQHENTCPVQI